MQHRQSVGSTVTSDPFFLGLLLIPGSGVQITAVPAARRRILVIDDDPSLADVVVALIDQARFAVQYRQLPGPHAQIVLLTSAVDASGVADQIAARSFVKKPFDFSVLAALLDRYA